MNRAGWTLGSNLPKKMQQHALRRFLYRATVENYSDLRRARLRREAFNIPLITDREWLACTRFATKKDGTFDERIRHCETNYPVGTTAGRND
jgi:hypothetical protein